MNFDISNCFRKPPAHTRSTSWSLSHCPYHRLSTGQYVYILHFALMLLSNHSDGIWQYVERPDCEIFVACTLTHFSWEIWLWYQMWKFDTQLSYWYREQASKDYPWFNAIWFRWWQVHIASGSNLVLAPGNKPLFRPHWMTHTVCSFTISTIYNNYFHYNAC